MLHAWRGRIRAIYVWLVLCVVALAAPPVADAAPKRSGSTGSSSSSGGSSRRATTPAPKVTAKDIRGGDFRRSRATALKSNGGTCEYCQAKPATHGDHVTPVKAYADKVNTGHISHANAVKKANREDNVIGACASCNLQKGAKRPALQEGKGKFVPSNPTPNAQTKIRDRPKRYQ